MNQKTLKQLGCLKQLLPARAEPRSTAHLNSLNEEDVSENVNNKIPTAEISNASQISINDNTSSNTLNENCTTNVPPSSIDGTFVNDTTYTIFPGKLIIFKKVVCLFLDEFVNSVSNVKKAEEKAIEVRVSKVSHLNLNLARAMAGESVYKDEFNYLIDQNMDNLVSKIILKLVENGEISVK